MFCKITMAANGKCRDFKKPKTMITSQQNIAVVKIFVIFQDYISVNTYHYIAGELSTMLMPE